MDTIEICEPAAHTMIECGVGPNGEGGVLADRPAAGIYCACLRGAIELELIIRDDGAGPAMGIMEDAMFE